VRWLLVLLMILVRTVAVAAATESNVTVSLFSIHRTQEVTFSPLGSNPLMRPCPHCAERRMNSPATLKWMNGEVHLDGVTIAPQKMEFIGAFRVQTEASSEIETAVGQWTVEAETTGLRILLTTSTERYVLAALNGESATDEPLESLKAMAVVARTFAQANAHRHATEGFDFCDSTHCQALHFSSARPSIEEAVQATTGESLWSGTQQAQAFATQHCGGEAEDASSVWPMLHAPYLQMHPDPYCLRRSTALWHADISAAQLARILQEQHWKAPAQIEAIHIVKRTPSGRAQVIEVVGQGKRDEVSASSLHFALDRALGWNQLRSEWYEITLNNGTVRFEGKGYGHGVGLCQAGSFEMGREGRNYREILNFYFPGTQVRITPNDTGWKQASGAGWILTATDSSQSFVQTGNSAWAKAQFLFPPKASAHPVVRLMPSTDLFRQVTNEPGWMLASTSGANIVLQPLPVLRSHGGESSTLLHEFLHVLVEQEADPKTPLWLREGLVEALAGTDRHTSDKMKIPEIENALAHPLSIAESQHAHAASAQLTQRLIERYGLQTMRSWLQSGVPATALSP
jgi:stage II sporulation protein D